MDKLHRRPHLKLGSQDHWASYQCTCQMAVFTGFLGAELICSYREFRKQLGPRQVSVCAEAMGHLSRQEVWSMVSMWLDHRWVTTYPLHWSYKVAEHWWILTPTLLSSHTALATGDESPSSLPMSPLLRTWGLCCLKNSAHSCSVDIEWIWTWDVTYPSSADLTLRDVG